ncbi:MAG: DEAD/DEAH box helicase [Elusimicrobiota bacterium]
MKNLRFEELSLSPEINRAVADMGFEEATPIQSLAIPHVLKGKDVIGQAQTGTGKTAAFGIPILELLDVKDKRPQALILCPTRELANQIAEELKRLAKYKREVNVLPVYGGQPIDRQIFALKKGVHIVIGTPGRLMDHMDRRTIKLDSIKMVVLDEADEMLDMGFRDDIELILKSVPKERQTVCFSATMPREFLELTKRYQRNPLLLKVVHDKLTVPSVEQYYFEVKENLKLDTLCRIIDTYDPKLALIFCNTKRKVDEVTSQLQARGYAAEGIHGDLSQTQRDRAMGKFRKGIIEFLVATDVAARGIDVENVEAVFNYDIPQDEEYYVHRIGRTGRAGKSGYAFSLVGGRDIYKIRDIQRYAHTEIKHKHVPSLKDVEEIRITQFMDKIKIGLGAKDLGRYIAMLERLIGEDVTSLDVAAVLLKMLMHPSAAETKPEIQKTYGNTGGEPGMVRLFISVGRLQNVRPGDILGAIAGETGLEGKAIGHIDVHDKFSFVDIPADDAAKVLSVMKSKQIKGHRINVDLANSK